MKVSELIKLLQQMPQDVCVDMEFEVDDQYFQQEVAKVSLEQVRGEQYVCIGG